MKTTTNESASHLTPVEAGADDAVEAALQAAHEALRPRQRRVWPWALACQVAILGVGYVAAPFFTTRLFFDKEAMEVQEAKVTERAKAYKAREEAKRARCEIQEEHLDPLKEQERAKRRKEVVAQVRELEAIAERMRERRDEELARLSEAPRESDTEAARTQLEEALKALAAGTDAIRANELIKDKEPYEEAVEDLLAKTEDLRHKADELTGLDAQDRGSGIEQTQHGLGRTHARRSGPQ